MKGRGSLVKLSVDWEYVEEAQSKCNVITRIMTELCMFDVVYTMGHCVYVSAICSHFAKIKERFFFRWFSSVTFQLQQNKVKGLNCRFMKYHATVTCTGTMYQNVAKRLMLSSQEPRSLI